MLKTKTQYTNSILKVQLNEKLKSNVAVSEMTFNNVRPLEVLVEDIKQIRSQIQVSKHSKNPAIQNIYREFQKRMWMLRTVVVEIEERNTESEESKVSAFSQKQRDEEEKKSESNAGDLDKFLAEDSASDLSSQIEDLEEEYNSSVLASVNLKNTE